MTRRPAPEIGAPNAIRPVASPVDTFVRPEDPAPSQLHQVAEGLAHFDKGLRGFLNKRREEQNEADRIRGEAAFNQANQAGWAESVRRGLVPANASLIFQRSYKKAQGNLAGIKLREKFNTAYLSWEGRNSDDPEAFEQFVGTFLQENIGSDDPYVLEGLNPHIRALTDDAYSVRSSEVGKATYNGNVNTQAALAGESIDYANQDGLSTGDGTNYEGLRGDLISQREEALSAGIRMEDYDAEMVKAIAAKAIEHQDPQLLDILDEVWPGYEDVKLSSIPDFRDIKQNTIEAIETDIRVRMTENSKVQKKADKEAEGKIVTSVFTLLDQDPTAEIPEDFIRQWEKYDPAARTKLAKARSSLQAADALESREDLLMVEQMIQDGATQKDIFDLVSDGIITDPTTLKTVLDRVERRRKAVLEGSGILKTQTSKRFLATIKERTTDKFGSMLFLPDGLTDEGLEATKDFEMMLIEWEEQNPNATLREREKAITEIGEEVLGRITSPEDLQKSAPWLNDLEGPQYVSEADNAAMEQRLRLEEEGSRKEEGERKSASPTQPDEQPGASSDTENFWRFPTRDEFRQNMKIDSGIRVPREADTERRKAWEQEQVQKHFTGEEAPKFVDLDPAFQDTLRANAEALGVDPEELTKTLWERAQDAAEGSDNTETRSPHPETVEENLVKSSFDSEKVQADIAQTIDNAVLGLDQPLSREFVDPSSNPSVNPQVHSKWANGILPVSIRNNNMGAISITGSISKSWAAQQPGFVGTSRRPKSEGGYYAKYATPEHGVAAASKLLERYGEQGINTANKIVRHWSTDTRAHDAYANTLVKFLDADGFEVDADTSLDLSDPRVRVPVLMAKSGFESGLGAPVYDDKVFERGAAYRLGDDGNDTSQRVFAFDHGTPSGDVNKILTASDRGYDPEMDNVKDDVKNRLVALQQAFGEQIPVVSGYRDPERNKKSGGARHSQHIHGNAIDISVKDMPIEDRVRLIELASEAGFTGIGVYDNSLHFDVGKRRYWGPSHRSISLPFWAKAAIEKHMDRT